MVSVVRPLIAAAFSGLIAASVMPADAAKRQRPRYPLAPFAPFVPPFSSRSAA